MLVNASGREVAASVQLFAFRAFLSEVDPISAERRLEETGDFGQIAALGSNIEVTASRTERPSEEKPLQKLSKNLTAKPPELILPGVLFSSGSPPRSA
jgi:hypothetical protein